MKKLLWIIIVVLTVCLCVSLVYNFKTHRHVVRTSDTVTIVDTLMINAPKPKDSVIVRHHTITLSAKHDTIIDTITKEYPIVQIDTITDSIIVTFPIVQKEYIDSSYHAWVSGYQASLDSIAVFPKTTIITNTNTLYKYNSKHWGVGIHVGVGVSNDKKVHPYIGVGIHYNIFSW